MEVGYENSLSHQHAFENYYDHSPELTFQYINLQKSSEKSNTFVSTWKPTSLSTEPENGSWSNIMTTSWLNKAVLEPWVSRLACFHDHILKMTIDPTYVDVSCATLSKDHWDNCRHDIIHVLNLNLKSQCLTSMSAVWTYKIFDVH